MDNFNWLVFELLCQQRMRELRLAPGPLPSAANEQPERRTGVKRALAASLVRLGLRLDPAAGEGLGAFDLSQAQADGSHQA